MSKLASAMMLWLSRGKAQTAAISKPLVGVESKVSNKERQNTSEDRNDKPEPEMYGEEEIILRGERDEVPFDQLPEEIREHYQKIPNWEYSTGPRPVERTKCVLNLYPTRCEQPPLLRYLERRFKWSLVCNSVGWKAINMYPGRRRNSRRHYVSKVVDRHSARPYVLRKPLTHTRGSRSHSSAEVSGLLIRSTLGKHPDDRRG